MPRAWYLQVMSLFCCASESMRVCAYAHAISLATDRAAFQMLLVVRVQEDWKGDEWCTGAHTQHTHTHTHTDGVFDA